MSLKACLINLKEYAINYSHSLSFTTLIVVLFRVHFIEENTGGGGSRAEDVSLGVTRMERVRNESIRRTDHVKT